jgi:hypothetical protein
MSEVKAEIGTFGTEVTGLDPDEFAAVYKKDLPVWSKVVKDGGATLD